MTGFITKNGTQYIVSSQEKTISGGKLGNAQVSFANARIIVGEPAIVHLLDGRKLVTSAVKKYL